MKENLVCGWPFFAALPQLRQSDDVELVKDELGWVEPRRCGWRIYVGQDQMQDREIAVVEVCSARLDR